MTRVSLTANPFYAARVSRPRHVEPSALAKGPTHRLPETHMHASTSVFTVRTNESGRIRQPIYAKIPQAPINGSPVPRLTSLYHHAPAGEYGDRRYPGNCGGYLIRDLLVYFQPANVFDPMSGSGTCNDVCRELGIPCTSG